MSDSRTKTARNEQRKLQATSLNTVGLAILGLGVLTPFFSASMTPDDLPSVAVSILVAYMLHGVAQLILLGLED